MATSEQSQPYDGKYVYCVIEETERKSFGNSGIGGRGDEVYTINSEGLAAVVSDTPLILYEPTRENALRHEQVNEMVMNEYSSVVPMSFDTLFKRAEDVVEFLNGTSEQLKEVLQKTCHRLTKCRGSRCDRNPTRNPEQIAGPPRQTASTASLIGGESARRSFWSRHHRCHEFRLRLAGHLPSVAVVVGVLPVRLLWVAKNVPALSHFWLSCSAHTSPLRASSWRFHACS